METLLNRLRRRHYPSYSDALNAIKKHYGSDYKRFTWLGVWFKPEREKNPYFIGDAGEWCDSVSV